MDILGGNIYFHILGNFTLGSFICIPTCICTCTCGMCLIWGGCVTGSTVVKLPSQLAVNPCLNMVKIPSKILLSATLLYLSFNYEVHSSFNCLTWQEGTLILMS